MMGWRANFWSDRRGSAAAEMALVAPLLVTIMVQGRFEASGIRPNFYENPTEDAQLMSLKFIDESPLTKS